MAHRTLPKGHGWEMQYRRMLRSREKMNIAYNSTEDYDDSVYHFFQDAWHLKDWLKKDPSVPVAVRSSVEKNLEALPPLMVTADIANGTKHFEIGDKHPPRTGAQIVERELTLTLGVPNSVKHTHLIEVAGAKLTATDLADQAIAAWESLLKSYGLLD